MKASIDRVFNRSRLYRQSWRTGQLEPGPGNLKGRARELHEFYDRSQTVRVFHGPAGSVRFEVGPGSGPRWRVVRLRGF